MAESDLTNPLAIDQALAMLEQLGYGDTPEEPFTVSNGVELRAVSAPPHLIADIELRYPEPPVPMVDITASESDEVIRQEPNPSDPTYQAEHLKWIETVERVRQRALLATSIEVVNVPDDVPGPDDDEWIDLLRMAGVIEIADEIPKAGTRGRRLAWLLYVTLRNVGDLNAATVRAMRMVGVPEQDVASMARMFQDLQGRRADQRRPAQAARPD